MRTVRQLNTSIRKLIQELTWFLSEIEALFSKPNDALRFRRLFLRMSNIKHGESLWIGRSFHVTRPSNLSLGERAALGNCVNVEGQGPIVIGNDFLGSTGLTLGSGTHDPLTMEPRRLSISIGDRVWCGFNVTILAGVTIGDDVVIGAGSIVSNNIPSRSLAVGIPAKVIKPLDRDPNVSTWTWSTKN